MERARERGGRLEQAAYDAVLCRHVLWTLPEPTAAIATWTDLLAPGGWLVLIEGSWDTSTGLTAEICERIVRSRRSSVEVIPLPQERYWGRPITDERYLLLSTS